MTGKCAKEVSTTKYSDYVIEERPCEGLEARGRDNSKTSFAPNPFENVLHISVPFQNSYDLSIYSVEGRMVYSEEGLLTVSGITITPFRLGVALEDPLWRKMVLFS